MVYASVAPFGLQSPHCGRIAVQRRITHRSARCQSPDLRILPNSSILAAGDTPLNELRRHGTRLEGEADTLGGLAQEHLGRVPRPRDTVTLDGTRIPVITMDGNRVARVHITPLSETPHRHRSADSDGDL